MMTTTGEGGRSLPARVQRPEELELARKQAELAALESELIERELELSTLEGELGVFEAEYLRVVGRRYAELDELKARITKARAARAPDDAAARHAAAEAQEAAEVSADQVKHRPTENAVPRFDPPVALKALYRMVARKVHPDLASSDEERTRRHQLMAAVNDAYRRADSDALRSLLADWEISPESVSGTGVPSELVRVIRQIAQVQRRMQNISRVIETLQTGELYALVQKGHARSAEGGNLLKDMAARLDSDIVVARAELATLEAEATP